jgi:hypothetical protein
VNRAEDRAPARMNVGGGDEAAGLDGAGDLGAP